MKINKEALDMDMVCSHCGGFASCYYIPIHVKLCEKCYKKMESKK